MKRDDIVLLDGAVGTSLWKKCDDRSPVWTYNLNHPELVSELLMEYMASGSQIVLTNTFAANRSFVSREGVYTVPGVVKAGVKLATDAVEGTDVKVMFTVGPLMEMMEPFGSISEFQAKMMYEEQIGAGMSLDVKPDIIYVQTFIDLNMAEIAISVAEKYDVPIFCTMSFAENGYTIMGNSVDEFIAAMEKHPKVKAIGLNCNITPELAVPVIAQFAGKTTKELIFKPNAGQPRVQDGKTVSAEDAAAFVQASLPALDYGVKYIGGCCGTDPTYIQLLHHELSKE